MLSGGYKVLITSKNIVKFVIITIVFLNTWIFADSSFYYNKPESLKVVGIFPVPSEWANNEIPNEQNMKLILSPSFYIASWSSQFITKGDRWIGVPTNPAENVFYLQDEIPAFFKLVLNWKIPNIGLCIELPFEKEKKNKLATLNQGNNIPFNITNPLDFSKISVDLNFPTYSYLYYANDWLFAAIGRFPLKWGDAQYPVHISPTTYQDNITISLKSTNASYAFHAITSYPLLSQQEEYIQKNYSDQHTAGIYFSEPSKYIFAHRLDFLLDLPWNTDLRIGLGELNVVGGKFPDIIDLNPVTIFHNTYGEGFSNVTGSVDFTLNLSNILKIYGEFVLDDANSPTETSSNYKPAANAKNIGLSLNLYSQNIWFEYSETSEWMYVTNYLPYLKINVRHFDLENNPGGRLLLDYPLGFIYGPDAKMFSFGINGTLQNLDISYDFRYNYLIKGLVNDNGTIRWKWFWDGWTGNVSESGATTPEKSGEANYQIFTAKISWKNFAIFYKTIDFQNYILALNTEFSF